MIKIGYVA